MADHTYELALRWTGNLGRGTSGYRDYSRDVLAESAGRGLSVQSVAPTLGEETRYSAT